MNRPESGKPPPTVPRPATRELLALAAAARPDWDPHALADVLAQTHYDGMTWGQVLVNVVRLMADPDAEPADLIPAVREIWRQKRKAQEPDTAHRGAAAVRAALHPDSTDH